MFGVKGSKVSGRKKQCFTPDKAMFSSHKNNAFFPRKKKQSGMQPAECRLHTTSPTQGFTCKKAVGIPSALTDTQETPPFRRTRIRTRPFWACTLREPMEVP